MLQEYVKGYQAELHSSTAGRTLGTAEIVNQTLNLGAVRQSKGLLFGGRDCYLNSPEAEFEENTNCVLLVSHRGRNEASVECLVGQPLFRKDIPGVDDKKEKPGLIADLGHAEFTVLDFEGKSVGDPGNFLGGFVVRRDGSKWQIIPKNP